MLEENKTIPKEESKNTPEVAKETKKAKVNTKSYTVIKEVTLKDIHSPGAVIEVEVGSDLETYLVTNKFVNKHGISRPN